MSHREVKINRIAMNIMLLVLPGVAVKFSVTKAPFIWHT